MANPNEQTPTNKVCGVLSVELQILGDYIFSSFPFLSFFFFFFSSLLTKTLLLHMHSHSQNITMPQSSAFSSIFVQVNDSAVPAAASHSVHVNGSVVPATASRPAHVQSADDIAALLSNMSISEPTVVKPTSASPSRSHASKSPVAITSASKDFPPLRQHQQRSLADIAPSVNKASVLDRIAERRRRVIADIAPSVNKASVLDRIAERRRRVIADIAPSVNKASVLDRIEERRRRRAIANITDTSSSTLKTSTTSSRVSPPTTVADPVPVLTCQKLSSSPSAVAATIPIVPAAMPEPAVAASAPQPDVAIVVPDAVSTVTPEPAVAASAPQSDVAIVVSEVLSTFVSKSTVAAVVSETGIAAIVSAIVSELAALTPPPLPDLIPITSEPICPSLIPTRRYGYIRTWLPGSYRENKDDKWRYTHMCDRIEISDRIWDGESLIPSAATGRRPRYQVPGAYRKATHPVSQTPISGQISPVFMPHTTTRLPKHFKPVWLTCKPAKGKARGDSRYCQARPRGFRGRGPYGYHTPRKGRRCVCPIHDGTAKWHIKPHHWGTTPAESGVDRWPKPKKSNKKVRWADKVATVFPGEKPANQCLPQVPSTTDPATIDDDFPEGFCMCIGS